MSEQIMALENKVWHAFVLHKIFS